MYIREKIKKRNTKKINIRNTTKKSGGFKN